MPQLWNEGQKAPQIVTPSHYPSSTGSSAPQAASTDAAVADSPAGDPAASSRKEEVWGGKPWKSSVVELGGEILCGEQDTHANIGSARALVVQLPDLTSAPSLPLSLPPTHQSPNSPSTPGQPRAPSPTSTSLWGATLPYPSTRLFSPGSVRCTMQAESRTAHLER